MLPDVDVAVRLQALDLRISNLLREISSLPKHIAAIEQKLGVHERRLEVDRAALAANQKDRKLLDGEIQMAQTKISKLKGQTLEAKTNEQYRAFQNEIDFCEREIRGHEDRILDLMTASEPLDKNVKLAETALKEERAQVQAEKQRAEKHAAEDRKRMNELQAERNELFSRLPKTVASNYERLRKLRGVAVSEAVDGRCSQCHISLRPQFLQELKRGEKIMFCESCARMLYYNPPKSPEDLAGANALSAR
jgi:predicted  nucleic acid-binding Zn-ribbon protein